MQIEAAVLTVIGAPPPWGESRPIEFAAVELDAPRYGEVLVRIETAGVCHSDLSRVSGDRVCNVPTVLGHEACGIIERLGDGVVDLSVGQKVVMTFMPRCGQCESCTPPGWSLCSRGSKANADGMLLGGGRRLHRNGTDLDHQSGVSAFATHAVIDQHSIIAIPNEIPSDVAALLGCAVLTGGGAILNAGRLQPGESVAVVGLGGVGLAGALVALGSGADSVVGVDTVASKLDIARELGLHEALTPQEATASGRKFAVVVDCVGSGPALETAISLTAPGGRTVTVGLPHPDTRITIAPTELVVQARSIIGSYMGSNVPRDDIAGYVLMYQEGRLPIEKLISGHIRLHELNQAMDDLHHGRTLRQVITFA
ncbi:zinc-binding dehydrogenase [Mycolicibacterium stellerae]|uniref:zinc-binding dehydrogenase n=1 Tax=Mycolicibacterium stellerae TaxID=2358193 RepID=UPI000F0B34DE|nr:alcohol dehydrogenase catalytic domain-containing protein [Mycolicibacterium stellerae]